MPAPPEITTLVKRFEEQLDAYQSGRYNETQLRREFVDPMFKALGWDMENVSGYAEAYKDAQIDKLVYELYGLSEDEIKIVEEGAAR
jgi:hypothetical protein